MKITRMRDYAPMISDIITSTDQTGQEMGESFTPLDKAIKNDDYSSVDLSKTKSTFQSGTNTYKNNLQQLDKMGIPARAIGKHKQLVAAYKDYTDACQDMVNTIDDDNQTVNEKAFRESEKTQGKSIEEVVKCARRIMMM